MALRFERRHLPFLTWYHKRLSGYSLNAAECCFLLLSAPTDELLLLQSGCLQPLSCQ